VIVIVLFTGTTGSPPDVQLFPGSSTVCRSSKILFRRRVLTEIIIQPFTYRDYWWGTCLSTQNMVICVSVLNRTRNKEIELLHSWVNLSVCGPDEGRNGFEISQSPDRAEEIGTDFMLFVPEN
jgi:hypothetical protein